MHSWPTDEAIPYDKDKGKWEEQLAAPLWKLTNDAVNKPAQLQQVKTFDAQVASDTTRDGADGRSFRRSSSS